MAQFPFEQYLMAMQQKQQNDPFLKVAGAVKGIGTKIEARKTKIKKEKADAWKFALTAKLKPKKKVIDPVTKEVKLVEPDMNDYNAILSGNDIPNMVLSDEATGGDIKFDDYSSMRKEFGDKTKNFEQVKFSTSQMEQALKHATAAGDSNSKAAADQTLVTAFNKLLDPTSVVRESEYARTGEGQSLISTIEGTIQRMKQGGTGLTDENRKDAVKMARRLIREANKNYQGQRKNYSKIATQFGMKPELVLGDDMGVWVFDTSSEAENANLPIGTEVMIDGRLGRIE